MKFPPPPSRKDIWRTYVWELDGIDLNEMNTPPPAPMNGTWAKCGEEITDKHKWVDENGNIKPAYGETLFTVNYKPESYRNYPKEKDGVYFGYFLPGDTTTTPPTTKNTATMNTEEYTAYLNTKSRLELLLYWLELRKATAETFEANGSKLTITASDIDDILNRIKKFSL